MAGVRLVNEVRTVRLTDAGGQSVSAQVRVRGIDARERADHAPYLPMIPSTSGWSGARSVLVEQLDPIAVIVEREGTVRRLKIQDTGRTGMALAFATIPLAALFIRGLARGRRR